MKKNYLLIASALFILPFTSCKQKSESITDDPKFKATLDSVVKIKVEKYVKETLEQNLAKLQIYTPDYRKLAKEETERAAGRAIQYQQRQEDAIMNAQR